MLPPSTRRARPTLQPLEPRDVPSAYDLGDAAAFNAFFSSDMKAFNADAEGRVAVGGHGTFTAYGIGDKLTPDDTRDDLIVGGDLDFTNGQVFGGNIVYGGAGRLTGVGTPHGSVRQQADVLPFADIEQDLSDKSAAWGAEAPNGRTTVRYSNLNLRGTNSQLDIFTVTPDQLVAARSICLIVPSGATVLINVRGSEASIQNVGLKFRGADAGHVLWNFPDATELSISGVGLLGSVLAPAAHLDFNNGTIAGTVVADSMAGNGQFNLAGVKIHIEFPRKASLSGQVFIDDNANDQRDEGESGLDGVEVILSGRDTLGRPVNLTALTHDGGQFTFGPMLPGTFTVQVVPPQRYADSGLDGIPGTVSGTPVGVGDVNEVRAIPLADGDAGTDYLLPLEPNSN